MPFIFPFVSFPSPTPTSSSLSTEGYLGIWRRTRYFPWYLRKLLFWNSLRELWAFLFQCLYASLSLSEGETAYIITPRSSPLGIAKLFDGGSARREMQELPCPVWLPTGVSTGAIYTIADSQKDKYIQIPLSNWEEPVGNSTWEEESPLIAQPHRASWRNSSRARPQLSAEPARETDAAVGRHFSSVRYFVLVDGQPWLMGETREREREYVWESGERRSKLIFLLSPL